MARMIRLKIDAEQHYKSHGVTGPLLTVMLLAWRTRVRSMLDDALRRRTGRQSVGPLVAVRRSNAAG